ncbi:MAG TPA: hypothetical protein VKV26_12485 [Dehalococcoidia bacterium]|nr:hypothetical protein [Dehalococcoidia bacterium]
MPVRGGIPLLLVVKIGFRFVALTARSWETAITSYHLAFEDPEEREILAYHWHQHIAQIPFPHLHLGPGAAPGRPELSAAHLPTGHVQLRDVIALAVRDFGVAPLRTDWADVLAGSD